MTRYISPELHQRRRAVKVFRNNVVKDFTIADIEKFLSRIEQAGGCWVLKNKSSQPYLSYKEYRAHRVSWELFRGKIPDNMTIDHLCMNRYCVNPAHLEPVTQEENSRRWNAK